MANVQRRTKAEVLEAIKGTGGIILAIANKLGIPRQTLWTYRQKWAEVEQAIEEARQDGLDFAETKLMTLIGKGDLRAIMFYLERKGKDRGWAPQQSLEVHAVAEPVQPIICFDAEQEPGRLCAGEEQNAGE